MSIDRRPIVVGSRGSPLALVQIKEINSLLRRNGIQANFISKVFETQGDRDKETSLTSASIPDDFFTNTLDQAVLQSSIDIAIHSAKDLPQTMRPGLTVFALTKSLDETDCFVGKVKFRRLKKGAKIGTSSLIREASLKELNPGIKVVHIRGTIAERIKLVEEGKCDGIVVATVALKRLGLAHLIKDIFPWEAAPLQGQLAVVGREKDLVLKKMFSTIDVRRDYGKVVLVGAGPGDPGLITQKGIKALSEANCVFYDYLVSRDLLQYAPDAEKIYVGKRKGDHTLPQKELSSLLRKKACQGKNVVRLKGGDPLIFGRGADEIDYLRAYHINVEVVPGVSSATGLPSMLGVPLTARGISSSVAFLSAHVPEDRRVMPKLKVPEVDTLVYLMGLSKLTEIVRTVRKSGRKAGTPVMVISKGSSLEQRVVQGTLNDIARKTKEAKLFPPALIIIGETVNFYRGKQRGMSRPSVLYTGTNPERYKAFRNLVHHPMISIKAATMPASAREELRRELTSCDFILFTSRFGVRYFFELIKKTGSPKELIKGKAVIVIGLDTARSLKNLGIKPNLVSEKEDSYGLLTSISRKFNVKGKKILFPRSSLPNPFLARGLKKLGAGVRTVKVYVNSKPPRRPLPEVEVGKIIFTSPSTVRNFLKDYRSIPPDWEILSKGVVTQKALSDSGYESRIVK